MEKEKKKHKRQKETKKNCAMIVKTKDKEKKKKQLRGSSIWVDPVFAYKPDKKLCFDLSFTQRC